MPSSAPAARERSAGRGRRSTSEPRGALASHFSTGPLPRDPALALGCRRNDTLGAEECEHVLDTLPQRLPMRLRACGLLHEVRRQASRFLRLCPRNSSRLRADRTSTTASLHHADPSVENGPRAARTRASGDRIGSRSVIRSLRGPAPRQPSPRDGRSKAHQARGARDSTSTRRTSSSSASSARTCSGSTRGSPAAARAHAPNRGGSRRSSWPGFN
jgi:hypothetical protein